MTHRHGQLDRTQQGAYEMQIAEKKCTVCKNFAGKILGKILCAKDKQWPEVGRCRYFESM